MFSILRVHDFAVDLIHRTQNDSSREFVACLSIDTLRADPVSDIELDFTCLVFALELRHLEFSFVQDLDNNVLA